MEKRIELHCHTKNSIGEGIIMPERLPNAAVSKELAGIAITDYFNIDSWQEARDAMKECRDPRMKLIYGATIFLETNNDSEEDDFNFYATLLVKNEIGRKNLFRILSSNALRNMDCECEATPIEDLNEYREGLWVGWNCDNAYLYEDYDKEDEEWNRQRIERAMDLFDYFEIAPFLYNPEFPVSKLGSGDITKWVIEYADKYEKPIVAVSAAKYIDPQEKVEWKMLQHYNYRDSRTKYVESRVSAHLRSTEEMLELFSYLGKEKAREIVIDNPRMIAGQIELDVPFGEKSAYPHKEGDKERLREICYNKAHELYGANLPGLVSQRIEEELSVICNKNHETMFLIMRELVDKAGIKKEPRNLRVCGDNSIVSYLCGIGTLNPLKSHYRCDKCRFSDFGNEGMNATIGYLLPRKNCPVCGKALIRDGFDLPYEYFLGIDGSKSPDFDLNVRPSKQKEVQRSIAELEGIYMTFKAGSCWAIARKRAIEIIEDYLLQYRFRLDEWEYDVYVDELAECLRCYGLHPGKIMIFPDGMGDVTDYLPLRKQRDGTIATGVDYFQVRHLLYGIEILPLDMHEFLYALEKRTKYSLDDISFIKDSLFKDISREKNGKFLLEGIFGGEFFDDMLRLVLSTQDEIKFWDFVKITAMFLGTGVWKGNAEELLMEGHCLGGLISTPEDCYDYFVQHGIDHKTSFEISESVRKGRADRDEWMEKWGEIFKEHNIPDWYIDSCRKIRYLFPRAHCVSYVQSYWKLIYYKVNDPDIFYRTFIDLFADPEEKEIISAGESMVRAVLDKISNVTDKDEWIYARGGGMRVLKTALEMYEQGYDYEI